MSWVHPRRLGDRLGQGGQAAHQERLRRHTDRIQRALASTKRAGRNLTVRDEQAIEEAQKEEKNK